MKIGNRTVKILKMKNRRGYAAICGDCLTEGSSRNIAIERMEKAIRRVYKVAKKKK